MTISATGQAGGAPLDEPGSRSPLATGSVVVLTGKILGRGAQLGSQILLGRFLGPFQFGLFTLGWTVVRLLQTVAPLGLHNGVISFGVPLYRGRERSRLRSHVSVALWTSLLFSGLLAALLFAGSGWLAQNVFHEPQVERVLRWFAVAIPFASLLRVAAAATRITKRMGYSTLSEELGQPVVQLLLIGLVLLAGWGILGAVGASVVSFGAAALAAVVAVYVLFGRLPLRTGTGQAAARQMILFSVPTALAGTLGMLNQWIDRLLLGGLRPASELGVYQAASQLAMLFPIILSGLATVFIPVIAETFQQRDFTTMRTTFIISTKWGLYLSLPLFLLMVTRPERILTSLFGPDYGSAAGPLVVLAVGQFVNLATGAVGFVLIMTRRERVWLVLSAVALAGNVLLNLTWIPRWGALGAATATAVANTVLYVAALVCVRIALGFLPYDRPYWKGLAAAVCAAMVLIVGGISFPHAGLIGIVASLVVAYAAFAAVLVAVGIDAEDREIVHLLTRAAFRRSR